MRFALLILTLSVASGALAHGGGLDRNGCHHDRKRGGYHCHGGSYDPPTEAPVKRKATPKRSDDTPQTLFGGTSAPAYDADVETAQKLLIELGYDPGEPDGIFGARTRSSVEAFEADNRLPVTGLVSQDLISKLIDKVAE